jgi:broad specificity phosphatase PhoE
MSRLTLLCCAATTIVRQGGFPHPDEPLDEGGRRKAAALRLDGPAPASVLVAPAGAARETAATMGLPATIEPRLADPDAGRWRGQSFAAVHAAEPAALAAWLTAPERGAPDGEPFDAALARMRSLLDDLATGTAPVLAITHPTVIRAGLCVALDLQPAAAMRIDIAPLARVMLSFNRGWRLQALVPA